MAEGDGAQRYYISDTNPNESIGGGGCLCSESKCEDRGGPYAIFHCVETDSNLSPHVVICAPCAKAVVGDIESGAERISAGQVTVDAESVEISDAVPERHENPVAENGYPVITSDDEELAI